MKRRLTDAWNRGRVRGVWRGAIGAAQRRGGSPDASAPNDAAPTGDSTLPSYADWRAAYGGLLPSGPSTNDAIRFSVVSTVSNTPPRFLSELVASIRDQTHENWELLLVDEASRSAGTRRALAALRGGDPRIRVVALDAPVGPVPATNAGLAEAQGDYIVFIGSADRMAPSGLAWLSTCCPHADVVYTDEDTVTREGWHGDPLFKPAWSPRLLLGFDYVGGLLCVRSSLLDAVGGLRRGTDGLATYDLLLRLEAHDITVAHVPYIAYHRRGWILVDRDSARLAAPVEARQVAIVQRALDRRGWSAHALPAADPPPSTRVVFDAADDLPVVKVVIPSRDSIDLLRRAVDGVLGRTDGVDVHLVVVDNGSELPESRAYFDDLARHHDNVAVQRIDSEFNFSALCNAGANQGPPTPYVLFINNDVEVLHRDWLRQLVGWLSADNEVVGVGPKLLFPDRTIQHAGVVLGFRGIAGHYAMNEPNEPRPGSLHDHAREVSCLTAACLLVRRSDFDAVGGFDETLPNDYQDVDLCLRLRFERGGELVYDPTYPLLHRGSATRGSDAPPSAAEVERIRHLWGRELADEDSYYSPHLSLTLPDFSLRPIPSDDADRARTTNARWFEPDPSARRDRC